MKKKYQTKQPCPCGSKNAYMQCCMRWHQGTEHLQAPDAQTLMRSRYTAYALKLNPYLLATWHPTTRPESLEEPDDTHGAVPALKWLGLHIHNHAQQDEGNATVEFTARYSINGKAHQMHENSTFEKIDGRWYYKDGVVSS